jgi:predicted ferric reductase
MTPRRLVGLAAFAVVLMPVVAFLGRERPIGCNPPLLPTPCDQAMRTPEWAPWVFLVLVLITLVLAVIAVAKARLLTLTLAVVVGFLIVLELVYVGSGYMVSARQPHDRAVAVTVVLVSALAGLWLIPWAGRSRSRSVSRQGRS